MAVSVTNRARRPGHPSMAIALERRERRYHDLAPLEPSNHKPQKRPGHCAAGTIAARIVAPVTDRPRRRAIGATVTASAR